MEYYRAFGVEQTPHKLSELFDKLIAAKLTGETEGLIDLFNSLDLIKMDSSKLVHAESIKKSELFKHLKGS